MENIPKNMILFLFIICLYLLINKNIEDSLSFNKIILKQQSNYKIPIKYKTKLISNKNILFHNKSISIHHNLSRINYILCPKGLNIIFELDSIKNSIKEKKKNIFNITIYLKIDRKLLFSLIEKNTNRINYKINKLEKLLKFNITLSKFPNLNKKDKLSKINIEINKKTFFIKLNNIVIFESKKKVIFSKLIFINKYYISSLVNYYYININNNKKILYKNEKQLKLSTSSKNNYPLIITNNLNFNHLNNCNNKKDLYNLNNINIRYLQSENENYITIIANGPRENIRILGNDFNSLPDEMYINNSPIPPAKILNLTKEGENIIILKWNSKLINCNNLFNNCVNLLSIDLSHFDSSKIKSIEYMFESCKGVKFINLTNFNPPSVYNLWDFAHNCFALTSIDMTNCNIPSGSYQYGFIENRVLISLDLSKWKPIKLNVINYFLHRSYNLILLDISNFDTTRVGSNNHVFTSCNKLKYLNLRYYKGVDIFKEIPSIKNVIFCIEDINNLPITCSLITKGAKNNCTHICFQKPIVVNPKDSNCYYDCPKLNEGQFCNYEHTEILTVMPEGYFLNATYEKTIDKCYYLCKYCLNYGNEENHNCTDCIPNYKLIADSNNKTNCYENFEFFYLDNILNIYAPAQDFNLVIDSSSKPKNEFINNIDDFMKDKDPDNSYIIKGYDYSLIIKPINEPYLKDHTSINIDFSNCIIKLKEIYPDYQLRVAQVIMENNNENNLIDQTEYSVYNQFGEKIDLSVCKDTNIKVEYSIKNNSLLNIEKILYFRKKGIDILQIKDNFFNDICYSYSDPNSNSDMILTDRVSDIYQNYSICEIGCEYESLNIENMKAICNCKFKEKMSPKVNEGNFKTYIASSFLNSNFGVIKCYKLVFGIKDKLNNIGFWLFGIMILFHFPLYIIYFIRGTTPIKNYINNEMENNGYKSNNSLGREKETISKMETMPNEDNKIISYRKRKSKFYQNSKMATSNENLNIDEKSKIRFQRRKSKFYIINTKTSNNAPPKNKENSYLSSKKEDKDDIFTNKNNMNQSEIITSEALKNNSFQKESNNINKKSKKKKKKKKDSKLYSSLRDHLYNKINDEKESNQIDSKTMNKAYSKFAIIKSQNNKMRKRNTLTLSNNLISTLDSKNKLRQIKNKQKKDIKEIKYKNITQIPLILINANNAGEHKPLKSNYILNIYDYNEAIIHDDRNIFRIFLIYLISKDSILNIIFIHPPLELKSLRICIFLFSYECDLAFNAFFYLTDNISDNYHYTGQNKTLFSLINNLIISFVSTLVSFLLLYFFENLTQSNDNIENLFREQEKYLKENKKYKVKNDIKKNIEKRIIKIMKCLQIKIIIFIIFEFLTMLFFYYYIIAFCHVYESTQISWLLDSGSSIIISFIYSFSISIICSILYKLSIRYKIKILYKIILWLY